MNNFSAQDLEQLQSRGISVEKVEAQLECFRNGFPELDIVSPASTKKGILAGGVYCCLAELPSGRT